MSDNNLGENSGNGNGKICWFDGILFHVPVFKGAFYYLAGCFPAFGYLQFKCRIIDWHVSL
ncbi:hypothetical protein BGH94_07040 [Snodgrassella alvi]|nr:hypothetical protein BGH94_07040 [Snodgrassella alvi]ORE99585.1 hypothetical protein BGH95_09830 [Snodgrassella alvi]PIT45667.1 hypothetical protein BHC45_04760 [Snodgrassella alvi]PIT65974.1 hypothetical protein BHC52_08365 [Snodgrassella alvi]